SPYRQAWSTTLLWVEATHPAERGYRRSPMLASASPDQAVYSYRRWTPRDQYRALPIRHQRVRPAFAARCDSETRTVGCHAQRSDRACDRRKAGPCARTVAGKTARTWIDT